jgi:hypothetical protein
VSDRESSHVPVPDSGIGAVLVSARSLAEYRAMFAASDAALRRYARTSVDELAAQAQADTDRGNRYIRTHPEQYRWGFFADPADHYRHRHAALTRCTADRRAHPERYVPGELPHLPFADNAFELTVSSHLLFSYADRLDLAFHRDSIFELMRVTRDELRIYPLVAMGSVSYPYLDQLRAQLADHGITTQVVDVSYEFQAGGNQMLRCTHRPD